MAKTSMAIPSVPPLALFMTSQKPANQGRTAHGMSLKMKPERPPHPKDPTRDAYGRMLPGNLMRNAAPPFRSNQGRDGMPVMRVVSSSRMNMMPLPPKPY